MMMIEIFVAALMGPAAPPPNKPEREATAIRADDALTIRPDKAYFLLRIHKQKGAPSFDPVYLRKPNVDELDSFHAAKQAAFTKAEPKLIAERQKTIEKKRAAEAAGRSYDGVIPSIPSLKNFKFTYRHIQNVWAIDHSKPFLKADSDNIYLVEVPPGDYVLYGASYGISYQYLHVCWCLGTVGFVAKAGVVTDLGYFYADTAKSRSDIPELREETGFGPSSDTPAKLIAGTIRPASSRSLIPSQLNNMRVISADYHAVGTFFNANAGSVNRLVAVPGILAYDGGSVIDVKTGKEAKGAQISE